MYYLLETVGTKYTGNILNVSVIRVYHTEKHYNVYTIHVANI